MLRLKPPDFHKIYEILHVARLLSQELTCLCLQDPESMVRESCMASFGRPFSVVDSKTEESRAFVNAYGRIVPKQRLLGLMPLQMSRQRYGIGALHDKEKIELGQKIFRFHPTSDFRHPTPEI